MPINSIIIPNAHFLLKLSFPLENKFENLNKCMKYLDQILLDHPHGHNLVNLIVKS